MAKNIRALLSSLVFLLALAMLSSCGGSSSTNVPATGVQKIEADPGMYRTISAAEEAATNLGCAGTHEHLMNGSTWYMPCEDHSEWMKQTDAEHDHDDSHMHDEKDSHNHDDSHDGESEHDHSDHHSE